MKRKSMVIRIFILPILLLAPLDLACVKRPSGIIATGGTSGTTTMGGTGGTTTMGGTGTGSGTFTGNQGSVIVTAGQSSVPIPAIAVPLDQLQAQLSVEDFIEIIKAIAPDGILDPEFLKSLFSKDKGDQNKIDKSQLDEAIKRYRQELLERLVPLVEVSKNLAVIANVLGSVSAANNSILVMQAYLVSDAEDPSQWTRLKGEFAVAKEHLEQSTNIEPQLDYAYKVVLPGILDRLENEDVKGLRERLNSLANALNQVAQSKTQGLDTLSHEITKAATWVQPIQAQ